MIVNEKTTVTAAIARQDICMATAVALNRGMHTLNDDERSGSSTIDASSYHMEDEPLR